MRMRRGRLIALTLIALALPTAALANSIDFRIGPAQFGGGSLFAAFGSPWSAAMVSNPATNLRFALSMVMFTPSVCHVGSTCAFTGTLTVTNRAGNTTLFTSGLFDGSLTRLSSTSVTLTASLAASPKFGVLRMDFITNGASGMTSGSGIVITPEPSTLFSFGTGLIGLAGVMRRKLKLCT